MGACRQHGQRTSPASANYWLQFIPIPGQPEGSHGAGFMGAIFATKFLTVVKVL